MLFLKNTKLNKTVNCADADFKIWSDKGYTEVLGGAIIEEKKETVVNIDTLELKPRRKRRTKAEMLADNEA